MASATEDPKPSTSTQSNDEMSLEEINKLMSYGKKLYTNKDVIAACRQFEDACSQLAIKFGQTSNECGEAYFYYGKALLDIARSETDVLGNIPKEALGSKSKEDDDEDEEAVDDEENEEDVQMEAEEEQPADDEKEDEKEDDKENEQEKDKEEKQSDDACPGDGSARKKPESVEDARYKRDENEAGRSESCTWRDRNGNGHYGKAIEYHNKAISVIRSRINNIKEKMAKGDASPEAEIVELEDLIPDITAKVEDAEYMKKSTEEIIKTAGVIARDYLSAEQGSSGFDEPSIPEDGSSSSEVIKDIGHLVRKKRKTSDEACDEEDQSKRQRTDDEEGTEKDKKDAKIFNVGLEAGHKSASVHQNLGQKFGRGTEMELKKSRLDEPENKFECHASSMTWDIDPIDKSLVYADLEVEEIQWDDDEDTPNIDENWNSKQKSSRSKRKTTKRSSKENRIKLPVHKTPIKNVSKTEEEKSIQQSYCKDDFRVLSDEIILRIFSFLRRKFLTRCAKVCKNWLRLAYDESLWKNVDLSNKILGPGVLGSILHRGTLHLKLKKTNIDGPVCLPDCPYRQQTSKNNKRSCDMFALKNLDASMYTFEKDGILTLLQKCKDLEVVILKGCTLSDMEIRALASNPKLVGLNMAMCDGVTTDGLKLLAKNCNRIKELNVGWTKLTADDCILIGKEFPGLEKLDISGMKETMTDQVLIALMGFCKNLTCIDLSDSPLIGATSIDTLITNDKLEKIALSRCYNIPASSISSIATLKKLSDLQLFGFVKERTVKEMQRLNPGLRINSEIFSTIVTPESKNKFTKQINAIMN
eukprot:gene8076-8940_t